MPSPKIIEIEQNLRHFTDEDKQWLLQQLMQQLNPDSLSLSKKQFNITPAPQGSGYDNTSINHDQVFVNAIILEEY